MARSILTIAQEAAERDSTAPAPTTLFNTETRVAKVLRTAAHDVLRDYLRRSRWVGMSEFMSTWVFSFRAGRYAYALPPDYLRMVPGTEQRNGWPMGLIGPATPQAWAWWLYGGSAAVSPHGWRIKNNVLWVDPTPTADELIVIEYISRYPVVSAIRTGDFNMSTKPLQTYAPVVSRDGWISLENDDLLKPYQGDTWGDTSEGEGWDQSVWGAGAEEVLKRLYPTSSETPIPQVRRETFTADTDTPAFEDDHILSLGMTWHLQRALGLPYAERAAEYEAEIESKIADDAGGGRGFRLCGDNAEQWDAWPLEPTGRGHRWIVG